MAEVMAHAGHIGPEAMNCSAPDTGNMGMSNPCTLRLIIEGFFRGVGSLRFS